MNKQPRSVVEAAADLTKTALPLYALAGRRADMHVATQIMCGVITGYDAVTPMHRFQVAHSMRDVADQLAAEELSKLVMPPRRSLMTWEQAAALVGLPASTLHSRYAWKLVNPKGKA